MAWKIEKWLSDVFPGPSRIYEEYRHLTRRELAIVAAGVLDLGLAQLLSMRLASNDREREEFLGLNGDGRAPAGSFGARIQLGVLTGTITSDDAEILRVIKNIRNCFAHRVQVDFTSSGVLSLTRKLCERWEESTMLLAIPGISPEVVTAGMNEIRKHLSTEPEAGAGLLLSIFSVYQVYFHRLSDRVTPIEDMVRKRDLKRGQAALFALTLKTSLSPFPFSICGQNWVCQECRSDTLVFSSNFHPDDKLECSGNTVQSTTYGQWVMYLYLPKRFSRCCQSGSLCLQV